MYTNIPRAARAVDVAATEETRDFYRAQEWVALAYLRPERGGTIFSPGSERGVAGGESSRSRSVRKLTPGLGRPATLEERVVLYSAGLEKLAAGESRGAQDFFELLVH